MTIKYYKDWWPNQPEPDRPWPWAGMPVRFGNILKSWGRVSPSRILDNKPCMDRLSPNGVYYNGARLGTYRVSQDLFFRVPGTQDCAEIPLPLLNELEPTYSGMSAVYDNGIWVITEMELCATALPLPKDLDFSMVFQQYKVGEELKTEESNRLEELLL